MPLAIGNRCRRRDRTYRAVPVFSTQFPVSSDVEERHVVRRGSGISDRLIGEKNSTDGRLRACFEPQLRGERCGGIDQIVRQGHKIIHAVKVQRVPRVAYLHARDGRAVRRDGNRHRRRAARRTARVDGDVGEAVAARVAADRRVNQVRATRDQRAIRGLREGRDGERIGIGIGVVRDQGRDRDRACGVAACVHRIAHGDRRTVGRARKRVHVVGGAVAIGVGEERVGIEAGFEDVAEVLVARAATVIPEPIGPAIDEIFTTGRVVRLARAETLEAGRFTRDPAERALDELIAQADPEILICGTSENGRDGVRFGLARDRDKMPATRNGVGFRLRPGERTADD